MTLHSLLSQLNGAKSRLADHLPSYKHSKKQIRTWGSQLSHYLPNISRVTWKKGLSVGVVAGLAIATLSLKLIQDSYYSPVDSQNQQTPNLNNTSSSDHDLLVNPVTSENQPSNSSNLSNNTLPANQTLSPAPDQPLESENQPFNNSILPNEKCYPDLAPLTPFLQPLESAEDFIQTHLDASTSPTISSFAEHQIRNEYCGWTFETLGDLYGKDRDLLPSEARNFYHECTNAIPFVIQTINPEKKPSTALSGPFEMDELEMVSGYFRPLCREISRAKGPQWAEWSLEFFDWNQKDYKYYLEKYKGNVTKTMLSSMKSNAYADNAVLLDVMDKFENVVKYISKKISKIKVPPRSAVSFFGLLVPTSTVCICFLSWWRKKSVKK